MLPAGRLASHKRTRISLETKPSVTEFGYYAHGTADARVLMERLVGYVKRSGENGTGRILVGKSSVFEIFAESRNFAISKV